MTEDDVLTESEMAIVNLTRTYDYSAGPLTIRVDETKAFRVLSTEADGLEGAATVGGANVSIYAREPIRRPPDLQVVPTNRPDDSSPPAA